VKKLAIKVFSTSNCKFEKRVDSMKKSLLRTILISHFVLVFLFCAAAINAQETSTIDAPKGKNPVIIIPGLTGSELINSKTGELVWFKPQRAKDDDLRLPVSANLVRNRDNLVPKDIIRTVQFIKILPETEIYERLIDALEKRGGYTEGDWNGPKPSDYQDTFYVFPYDWRRDNVENARLLVKKVEDLKRKLGKPNLKFNIIAHSMGGLIARYAAMYGNTDLPAGKARPTWAGARDFDKIFLLGTPNEGSTLSVNALLNGFSYIGGGLNLPFIQNINKFDVFTIPAMYQLLPHDGTLTVYDENLKPISVDLYNPKTWEKYGWTVWQDGDFKKKMSLTEQRNAKAYFQAVLSRAKRFQAALDANTGDKLPVSIYLMGADCKETQNAVLLLHDEKKDRWKLQFKAENYTRTDGTKVTAEELKPLLFAMGDGVVTQRSLKAQTSGNKTVLPVTSELYQCEDHNKLVTNLDIQGKLLSILFGSVVTTK
jgi:pimeloyl-ACP methyl ester carboxylesterase